MDVVVGAAALNQTPLDWTGNRQRILRAIAEARHVGVQALCLPELCVPGYGCEDAFLSPDVHRRSSEMIRAIEPSTEGMAVIVGLPLAVEGRLHNTACVIVDGRVRGFVAKHVLAGSGVYYEPRWFSPWPLGRSTEIEFDGSLCPVGDLIFDLGGLRIGFEICEDAWGNGRRALFLADQGIDLIFNPSASHFAFGKFEQRKRLVEQGSRLCSCAYVYCNHIGNDAGRLIYDGGSLIAHRGVLAAVGPRFSFSEVILTAQTVRLEGHGPLSGEASEQQPRCVSGPSLMQPTGVPLPTVETARWELSSAIKEEEFTRAVTLGLFDYMRKSRSSGFVVSLSGGADSAAVSCLVTLMADLACAELGYERFHERLSYWEKVQSIPDLDSLRPELLACLYQQTENSSATTREAATALARALGTSYFEFDVQPVVESYVALAGPVTRGRQLTWSADDLTLQNIQARARGPAAWLVANLRGALLLTTSNRSEAAVGYTTMDGDTCGGLSPIGGIDKAFLRRWLRWLERVGVDGRWRVPALSLVNAQEPTAELRPLASKQTDEQDLMPYAVLDRIERLAIRDRLSPLETFRVLQGERLGHSPEDLLRWTERFYRLWVRSQWKRERYAPSFHLDDENLDPKTWCRFPILSGGFDSEIAEMYDVVKSECS